MGLYFSFNIFFVFLYNLVVLFILNNCMLVNFIWFNMVSKNVDFFLLLVLSFVMEFLKEFYDFLYFLIMKYYINLCWDFINCILLFGFVFKSFMVFFSSFSVFLGSLNCLYMVKILVILLVIFFMVVLCMGFVYILKVFV